MEQTEIVSYVGVLEKIIYSSPDQAFTVALLNCQDRTITVVGNMIPSVQGEKLKVSGYWSKHAKYGTQFTVQSFEVLLPDTLFGIEEYLGSRILPGIGPSFAKKLVTLFGAKIWDILEHEPQKLRDVDGIGPKKYKKIVEAWKKQQGGHKTLSLLASFGIYGNRAKKICDYYGGNAIAIVQHHPYRLAIDIDGIGFITADQIAQKVGTDPQDPDRIEAGILHCTQEAQNQGHCYLPQEDLILANQELLKLDADVILPVVERMAQEDKTIHRVDEEDRPIYPKYLYLYEKNIASILLESLQNKLMKIVSNMAKFLQEIQQEMHITFVETQIQAIQEAISQKICIITGGPGVGKTTIIKALVHILQKRGDRIALAAPTGRAANRLPEATDCDATTIHRLLRFNPHTGAFDYNAYHQMPLDHLIIDETSMVDISLAYHLLSAVEKDTSITLVGDADQLPSVGPGNFLADLIQSKIFPVVKLHHIFRQSQGSSIVHVAHSVNSGRIPKIMNQADSDIFFMPVESPEKGAELIVDLVTRRLPQKYGFDSKTDIQVITPMYRGLVGAEHLNDILADSVNPSGLQIGTRSFRQGDKVMQIVNNYDKDVYNGDIGIIMHYHKKSQESIVIDFGDHRYLSYVQSELDELVRSYAITIHKSQGSEYPAVVIPMFTEHYIMLERNLLYTAITRGKKLVVLVGEWRALQIAIQRVRALHRYTRLSKYLTANSELSDDFA